MDPTVIDFDPTIEKKLPIGPPEAPIPEAIPTPVVLPAGKIKVIDRNGAEKQLDVDWLLKPENAKIFNDEGFSIPGKKSEGPVEAEPGKIKVIAPDGTLKKVASSWLADPEHMKIFQSEGFTFADKDTETHQKEVDEYVKAIKDPLKYGFDKDLNITNGPKEYKPEEDKQSLSKITDDKGNYKMISPSGDQVLIPQEHMMTLLAAGAGFKFADPKFQAMVDAQRKIQNESDAKGAFQTGLASTVRGILPGGDYLQKRDIHTSESALERASYIASNLLTNSDKFETAKTVGTILGVGAQLLSPTGIIGEVKLAMAAKTGIMAKLAPEGAGFLRQLAVKTLATGVEGAIISSPQALAQVALDDNPKAAAESLATGFGIGAFLGAGGKLLGGAAKLVEKGGEHFKPTIAENIVTSAGGDIKAFEKLGADKKEFVDTLLDKGLSSKSKTDDVLGVLKKLSTGDDLVSSLKKLDAVAEKTSVSELISKLGGEARAFEGVDHAAALKGFEEKLTGLADKSGNISLENLQKFVKEAAEDIKWSPKDLKKGVGLAAEDLMKTAYWGQAAQKLTELGDIAASKVDAKTAAQWLSKKSMSNMAQYLHAIYFTTEEGALRATEELNPLVKKLTGELAGKALSGAGTIAGGTVGGLIGGGLPGAVAGGAVGGAAVEGLKKVGTPLLEKAELSLIDHYAGNAENGSKLGGWLVKNKTASAIGSYIALDATKSLANKVEAIGPFIDKLRMTAEKTPAMYLSAQDPVKAILGSEASELSKAQQYSKLAEKAAIYTSNPTVKQQMFDLHIAPLFKDHPELAKQVMADYDKKFQVVNDILKTGNTKQPEAFVQNKPFQPTPAQMKEIEAKLKVVNNPFAILDGLKNGSVTKAQVDIVAQLNPAILQKMREELLKSAYGGKATLSYQQRLSASIIMGAPLDPSITNGQLLQSNYNNGNNNSNAPEKQPRKQGNNKPLKADRIAGYSLSQRISKV